MKKYDLTHGEMATSRMLEVINFSFVNKISCKIYYLVFDKDLILVGNFLIDKGRDFKQCI